MVALSPIWGRDNTGVREASGTGAQGVVQRVGTMDPRKGDGSPDAGEAVSATIAHAADNPMSVGQYFSNLANFVTTLPGEVSDYVGNLGTALQNSANVLVDDIGSQLGLGGSPAAAQDIPSAAEESGLAYGSPYGGPGPGGAGSGADGPGYGGDGLGGVGDVGGTDSSGGTDYGGGWGGGPDGGDGDGGGDCFLTTAVTQRRGEADDGSTLTILRVFRDTWMQQTPERLAMIEEYREIAPKIVAAIPLEHSEWDRIAWTVDVCARAIKMGAPEFAMESYQEMVIRLEARWL